MKKSQRALVLAPHTDDGELGCGGTITRLIAEGTEVFYVAFSLCKRSLPAHLPPDTLEKEVKVATKILGIPSENLILFDYDVRRFKEFRQDILEDMVKIKNKINPDLVFLPTPADIHQDHQVISEEGLRAFKQVSILGYELPWNNVSFNTGCFIKLDASHVENKVKALGAYKSQKHRTYLNDNFIRSLATIRGVQITAPYAEAFEVIRWVI
ncbi:MAG TPA: PIG-L family deacetylase [Cyclobacteriaceae bacterium]|nr:PIG-L family deacetylase [Cyclobacteriaceae bacterium]